MSRTIAYISGTRADFGLMRETLGRLHRMDEFHVEIYAVGMHLDPAFGNTINDIENSDLPIVARVPVDYSEDSGAAMARGIGHTIIGLTDMLNERRPWLVLLLGDRGEALAGAIAAVHLALPVAHIHGGERSGTVDESVRHAISKLAHVHFASTEGARERLIRMGERSEHVHVTGAPGLTDLQGFVPEDRRVLCDSVGFDPDRPVALLLFHPDLYAPDDETCVETMLAELVAAGSQVLALRPNADAGGGAIRRRLESAAVHQDVHIETHLERNRFLSWMARADVMIGNSSAGIIEAASFDTPVINVGERQKLRERNANVVDVSIDLSALPGAIDSALKRTRSSSPVNIYGDGDASQRICATLAALDVTPDLLSKVNEY